MQTYSILTVPRLFPLGNWSKTLPHVGEI